MLYIPNFGSGEYHGNDVPYLSRMRIRLEGGFWIVDDLRIKGGYTYTSSQYLSGDYANIYDKLPTHCFRCRCITEHHMGGRLRLVCDGQYLRQELLRLCGPGYYYPPVGNSFMFTMSYEFLIEISVRMEIPNILLSVFFMPD